MEILIIVAAVLAAGTCFDPLQRRHAILRNVAIVSHYRSRRSLSPFQIR